MGKLSGTALVLLGCAGLVASWAAAQKRRQAAAEELIRLLAAWAYSLERERVRLPEFLAGFVSRQEAVALFLGDLAEALAVRRERSGALLWRRVLEENRPRLDLGAEMWELFLSADGAFFGTSSRESLRCAEVCRRRMEECLERERAEHARRRKLYTPLGMLGGVLIILLLI